MELIHVLGSQNALGEGPLWSVEENALYWVDIDGKTIHRYCPSGAIVDAYPVTQILGSLHFETREGSLQPAAMGFRSGIWQNIS